MSLSADEVHRVVRGRLPVLCLDTCALLDLVRDVTREAMRAHDLLAAQTLLAHAEHGRLVVLIAKQVHHELRDNISSVLSEAENALERFRAQASRIDEIAAAYGARGMTDTNHLAGHFTRARAILDRWLAVALQLSQGTDVADRALIRVNLARAPASPGKQSMKDCVVIESYYDAVRALNDAGGEQKIVFASSNVKDYCGSTRRLLPDIAAEFEALRLELAPSLGAAKHLLGL